jgi:hypothetical protein
VTGRLQGRWKDGEDGETLGDEKEAARVRILVKHRLAGGY